MQKTFNDKIVDINGGLRPVGIWGGYDQNNFLGNEENAPRWTSMEANDAKMESFTDHLQIGLPWAYSAEIAVCAALNARAARALDDDTLMALLSKGVYLDSGAVRVLNERGFGQYVGFRTGREFSRDAIEDTFQSRFSDKPFSRDMRQSFWGGKGVELVPLDDKAECLAHLVNYQGQELAPCSLGCHVNSLGGRVVASGYASWKFVGYVPKFRQMHAFFAWLAKDCLPAEVNDSRVWTNVLARRRADGSLAVAVANLSLDDVDDLNVTLHTTASQVRLVRNGKDDAILPTAPVPQCAAKRAVSIPVEAFELAYLETL